MVELGRESSFIRYLSRLVSVKKEPHLHPEIRIKIYVTKASLSQNKCIMNDFNFKNVEANCVELDYHMLRKT